MPADPTREWPSSELRGPSNRCSQTILHVQYIRGRQRAIRMGYAACLAKTARCINARKTRVGAARNLVDGHMRLSVHVASTPQEKHVHSELGNSAEQNVAAVHPLDGRGHCQCQRCSYGRGVGLVRLDDLPAPSTECISASRTWAADDRGMGGGLLGGTSRRLDPAPSIPGELPWWWITVGSIWMVNCASKHRKGWVQPARPVPNRREGVEPASRGRF